MLSCGAHLRGYGCDSGSLFVGGIALLPSKQQHSRNLSLFFAAHQEGQNKRVSLFWLKTNLLKPLFALWVIVNLLYLGVGQL